MVRKITIDVTDETMATAVVWGYPRDDVPEDDTGPLYEVPTYKLIVRGTMDNGQPAKREFEAIRFGVQQQTTKHQPRVVGLAKEQTHTVKKWLAHYAVHSAESEERGAWQVIGEFLIHDGPDNPRDKDDPYASIGCVELCGRRGFTIFNEYLQSISGSKQSGEQAKLREIGESGSLSVHYQAASRPKLKPLSQP